jgi:cytochrome oxidase Cu insertion factor (SCO1/SenC/PrrC family)
MDNDGVTITGSWTHADVDVATHSVTYNWGTTPSNVYDSTGTAVTLMLPTDSGTYVNGAHYTVDTTYDASTVVYTHDTYGNVNGTYTFSGWTDPNNGTMDNDGVTITDSWTHADVDVATHSVTYNWGTTPSNVYDSTGTAVTLTLPTDSGTYVNGAHYTVDTTYDASTVVYTHDTYGNVNGTYTFSGWTDSNNGTMDNDGVTITGSWTHADVDVATHSVTYNWGTTPSNVYDSTGTAVTLTLPTDSGTYVNGAHYTVDTTYDASTVVYTHDTYGNVNGTYTFSGWTDPNNGTMDNDGVTITGSWTHADVDVATHSVTYNWGTTPSNVYDSTGTAVTLTLPTDSGTYVNGAHYTVDTTYDASTVVYTHDTYGNVNGTYTFSGWTDPNNGTMDNDGVTITGSWTHADVDVATHSVTYNWGTTPSNVYDSTGTAVTLMLPTDSGTYVNGAHYTVDTTYDASTVVYTHDTYGNVNGTYTFSGWTDPNNGTMDNDGVTITGSWTHADVDVATHSVTYNWGTTPSNVYDSTGTAVTLTLPTDSGTYVNGAHYTVDTTYDASTVVYTHDTYGNVNGTYTFSGWTDPNNGTMDNDGVTITGSWTHADVDVATHSVTYNWGTTPSNVYDSTGTAVTLTLPTDSGTYVNGAHYTVDTTYDASTVVYTHDTYGNVNGTYTFSGWTDPNNGTMGDANLTITGSWTHADVEVIKYTVTFYLGTTVIDKASYVPNQPITKVEVPAKAGYTVLGWFSNTDCTETASVPNNMPEQNLNFYAKSIINKYDLIIHYLHPQFQPHSYPHPDSGH